MGAVYKQRGRKISAVPDWEFNGLFFTPSFSVISMALIIKEEFNISKASRDFYINLMRDARQKLGVKTSSYQLPILPPSPSSYRQIQFKDMLLRADDKNMIRLRLRWDNLYLVGFQINAAKEESEGGRWMEFTPDSGAPQLIPGSTYLGFTGGYDALLSASNIASLDKVEVGKDSLLEAVIRLNNPSTSYAIRAKSLIIVLIMICESLRFTYITDLLAPTFVNRQPIKPNASNGGR
ncbi:hypothetical protein J5N97_023020 [Dioscorea zingiberensis]|uniref:rRNA N-glycosylase n=1 Tax=Dioscorea zingiberensis TaxID=325984 RepID=A0A9D5HBJ1_9LILI|nr:hypothetical protein J5N97_023020 [Dioscorea zingiberensis]